MKKFISEFKDFAMKGNVLDLAVGVIVGAAFGKIVTSFVNDIFTPLLSLITGQVSFSSLAIPLGKIVTDEKSLLIISPQLRYGSFLQTIFDFLIVALAIFLMIQLINKTRNKIEALAKKEQEQIEEVAEIKQATEIELLTEIRDLLKEKNTDE